MTIYHSDNGLSYDDGIDTRFKTETIKDVNPKWHYLTLGELKHVLGKLNLPDDTPIYYDIISESLLTSNTSWKVTPMHWESAHNAPDYLPCVRAWQIFQTVDKNGDVGLVLTAHY